MPNITYSLGGTSFTAVPKSMDDARKLPVRSEATLGRGLIHSIGVDKNIVILKGQYMTKAVRDAILVLFTNCSDTGTSAVFNDGYTDRDVLIEKFAVEPIVGSTEGYSFTLKLVIV